MISSEVKEVLNSIREVVGAGFRELPYIDKYDGVFRSHFDWHSSVHAHWTLLSSSRVLGDKESAQKIIDRLGEVALLREHKHLLQNPKFELPYGQAWLLLLIFELEKHGQNNQGLYQLKSESVSRVGFWLMSNEFPDKNVDSYHSWLITYFLFKKSNSDTFYPHTKHIDEKFNSVISVRDEDDPKDFFSSESLFQILKQHPKKHFDIENSLIQLGAVSRSNCHHLGKLISYSWATPQNLKTPVDSSLASVQAVLKRPNLWKEDFETVSHWIPQFLWFGLWLSLGSP